MKQKIRIAVGLYHYVSALALFLLPVFARHYNVTSVAGPVVGILLILTSSFARYELGVVRILAYKEHLYVACALSVVLLVLSPYASDLFTRLAWILLAFTCLLATIWALYVHHITRRRIVFSN
jgi:hypothetical protein